METLRRLAKNFPTFLLAFALAMAVWISAVTSNDPLQQRVYPRTLTIELVGQDPSLILLSEINTPVSLTMNAPSSIWERLINEQLPVRAFLDLSSLPAGSHTVPVQIQVGIRPMEIVDYSPDNLEIVLEPLSNRSFTIQVIERGQLPVGFETGTSDLDIANATVSGPKPQVDKVTEVRAVVDLSGVMENINRTVNLQAVDASGSIVNNLTISPSQVDLTMNILQLGGYRNVVVKAILVGQVNSGYRVTNISVYPPAVTVFSPDPRLVTTLPGFVETQPLDLTGGSDDLNERLSLNLPPGISVVGEQNVEVQVGIAAIEGSLKLTDMQVEVIGVASDLTAENSPARVDVLLSGPIPQLDQLLLRNVRVIVDMTGDGEGTYQRQPQIELNDLALRVDSVLPGTVEVTLTKTVIPTPTPR